MTYQELQAALDASAYYQIPAGLHDLARPVYPNPGQQFSGFGRSTLVRATDHDALAVIPPNHRYYDPAQHYLTNPLSTSRYSLRTLGTAAVRVADSLADMGWDTPNGFWRNVRQFCAEMTVTANGTGGGMVCGLAWHKSVSGAVDVQPAPWYVRRATDPAWAGCYDLKILLAGESSVRAYRYRPDPSVAVTTLRFGVNLDAGTVYCEQDGVALPQYGTATPPPLAGSSFAENDGAAFWVGGARPFWGNKGGTEGETAGADTTFHAFRLWRVSTPRPLGSGYNPWGWDPYTVFVLPLSPSERPRVGDPAFYYTGELTGFGYLVPLGNVGSWNGPVSVSGLSFETHSNTKRYGSAVMAYSCLDFTVSDIDAQGFAHAVAVCGGPGNNYPVALRDVRGDAQWDSLARLQWCDGEAERLTAKSCRRSVLRADACGSLRVRNVWHSPDGEGFVRDVIRAEKPGFLALDFVRSNYEGGNQPANSYLRLTGEPDSGTSQLVRVTDYLPGLGCPAKAIDRTGLPAATVVELKNSLALPDTASV